MFVLGNGCWLDGIGEQIVVFCEKVGFFFVIILNGWGIVVEIYLLFLGVFGIFGDGRVDEYFFDILCDLLIVVGVFFGGLVICFFLFCWCGLKVDVVYVDFDLLVVG